MNTRQRQGNAVRHSHDSEEKEPACNAEDDSPRIELFFSSPSQLRERVQLLQSHGHVKFNLVNKNAQDDLSSWCKIVKEECPTAHICAHYSLKYKKVARKGNEAHTDLLMEFVEQQQQQSSTTTDEILLVSGGHNSNKARPRWNTVDALQRLAAQLQDNNKIPTLAVAYNPYIPDAAKQQEETDRLQAKLDTGLVSKVYLQFGTDLIRLKQALELLTKNKNKNKNKNQRDTTIAGSVFLPTKQLIAQQKFRPWNGVFLSRDFLESPEKAQGVVVEILKLYKAYHVEPLWEAPGVRSEKDLLQITDLMKMQVTHHDDDKVECAPLSNQDSDTTTECAIATESPSDKPAIEAEMTKGKDSRASSPATKRQKTALATAAKQSRNGFTESSEQSACLLLFGSHDLRLYDNLAVQEACQRQSTVIPVFLWSPLTLTSGGIRAEALEVLLKEAVSNLSQELESFGLKLISRSCPSVDCMKQEFASLLRETNPTAVCFNRDFTPHGRQLEAARMEVAKEVEFSGVTLTGFQSTLLYDIDAVSLTKGFNGGHWGTLMPFFKNCKKNYGEPRRPIPSHETFGILQNARAPTKWPRSDDNLPLAVLPPKVKPWHQPIKDAFPDMSHRGAQDMLNAFFSLPNSGYRRYDTDRSRADKETATSRLSCHLRLGTLSPNELYWRWHQHHPGDSDIFGRRLIWRDLAYYQLRCFPQMSWMPIRAHYKDTAWVSGPEADRRFEAWKWGRTGYPIVDAGMRELYKTGWMTQTVRMVVASFLVEYLRVHWARGCEWFHYTLVDADTAINAMMWQNAGKCGIDQWNFVLSPESASQCPTGKYTKKWVPELQKLPLEMLHRPWQTPNIILERYGVVIGKNYPERVVKNLKEERAKSIESTLNMRRKSQEHNDSKGYDVIILPNGESTVVFTKKEYRIDQSGRQKPAHEGKATAGGRGNRRRRVARK
ncbi:Deoxyribodipyrimidine photo-lyase [Seminavis robusta]|uniref:Deoxyribodipyrimidine photo-lyase n=1 Tax=Seminavis robusta TaxID=568900 RepID=A0A9N8HHS1_9STRA|nr:Deoxyribodipyrimidine photo-lyase [Seminavis robusta]|eukprot:Sro580_g170080.1 Deoxyribodipyrimidine photo-lyase (946) ;mRNA; f:8079-10916